MAPAIEAAWARRVVVWGPVGLLQHGFVLGRGNVESFRLVVNEIGDGLPFLASCLGSHLLGDSQG